MITKSHWGGNSLVYCSKCGTKNEEDVIFCVECGANLTGPPTRRSERGRREKEEKQEKGERPEQECFGLPHGGAIAGILLGVIILIWGFSVLLQQMGIIAETLHFWYIIIIAVGILIVAGAVYKVTRPRKNP